MPALRPIQHLARPNINELAAFLLSPQSQTQHIRYSRLATRHVSTTKHRTPLSRTCPLTHREFSTTPHPSQSSPKPQSHDRGPPSTEDTQTDFGTLNVLGNTPAPSTSIDAWLWGGVHLDNGVKVTGGGGVLLVAGEAFSWRPWEAGRKEGEGKGLRLVNEKGQWDVGDEAWGLLGLVWPKPGRLRNPMSL